YDIAILHLIPQLFNRAVDQDTTIFQELTYLLVGGDRVNRETVETVRKHCPGVRILHMYGPTENTTFSSYLPVEREYNTSLPIGRPIANSTVYLLDKYEYPVPLGVIGELWVGGVGVARGYLNNPELTAAKFFNFHHLSLIIHHSKLYRTGDLARWLPGPGVGGAYIIEFLGRSDHQVKVRGIRVELGEIENSLLKHNGVKEAVVVDRADEEGEIYLCAYIVPAGEGIADAELREYLTAILPRNMIPAYFIPLEKIPVTTVGKINKKALPEPLLKINEAHSGPVDKIEAYLVETWSYVLSLPKEKIARHINFFALGGHSLKATVLLARIHKELDVKIPLAELFKTPTIKGLAEYIRSAKEEAFFAVEAAEEREYYPLSSAQRRLYLLQQMDLNSVVYNMPLIMMLDKEIAKDHLERIIRQIIQRHESFRTSFETVNEELVQKVHHDVDFDIEYYELETIDQATGVGAFISKFDLSRAPLLRVKIITLAGNKYILIVDMHHIISDGFSMDILLREFPALYEGEQLPPLRIQYKDYTYWQNSETVKAKIKDQEEFWMKELRGDIPILDLPFDYPRPQVQSFQGSFLNFAFNREETLLLKKAALERGVTLYLLLVTLFDIFLYKLSGQEDIVLGTPIAGRRHADLQAIVGMFVNTLLLRNFPSGGKNFVEFLEEVKIRTLRAFENQDYQFEDLVEKIAVGRDPGRNPLFDVMFTWQEQANKKDDSTSRLYEG
ncbi:MAG TPA: condensation domain-containing protein, partial [Candidatus Deferrimicrobium sp.]|nr:condensation domain-containing protein [Candidatus Deferrimicrobium sp.]